MYIYNATPGSHLCVCFHCSQQFYIDSIENQIQFVATQMMLVPINNIQVDNLTERAFHSFCGRHFVQGHFIRSSVHLHEGNNATNKIRVFNLAVRAKVKHRSLQCYSGFLVIPVKSLSDSVSVKRLWANLRDHCKTRVYNEC